MEISVLLGISLGISFIANVVLYRLASWQAKDLTLVSDNIGDLIEIIKNYAEHLKRVYELEAFYGDETLQHLMEHTSAVRNLIEEQYGDVSSITEPIEYETKDLEDAKEENS
jgi:uncharacterized protein involved in cysteine biosynthesis